MVGFSFGRFFRLSSGGIECDNGGLRAAGVALLGRNTDGDWTVGEARELGHALSRAYGFPVEISHKMAGFKAVANALQDRNVAKAQIAALLLQLPDPLPHAGIDPGDSDRRRLARDLIATGLLKADADWDEKHPRTGVPPNSGWFAPKPKEPEPEAPTDAKPGQGAPARDDAHSGELAFLAPASAAGEGSLLAGDLSATALSALATLAEHLSVPTILFGAIFVPSANHIVDEGPVPGRPNMAYRWAHDETEVTFKVLIDGQWRTLTVGEQRHDLFYNRKGEVVGRIVGAKGGRTTLVTSVDVLDRALADLERADDQPIAGPTKDDNEPKLCPDPTPEPKTTKSANSIAYQEYVSKLPYGLAIKVGGVNFDGCDDATGTLLEAKANIDFMFDNNDQMYWWVNPSNDPKIQMKRQADTALAAGRDVVWHAQTEKGFRGLSNIKNDSNWPNLSVVYDPK